MKFPLPSDFVQRVNRATSTGYISGMVVSINAEDPTAFDVSEGYYQILDNTDPFNPTFRKKHFLGVTGVPATFIASAGTTYLTIDKDKNITQRIDGFPARELIRTEAMIGSLIHGGGTVIEGVSQTSLTPVNNIGASLSDLALALGAINMDGNNQLAGSPAGNLKLFKSEGEMFFYGVNNKGNYLDPNHLVSPDRTAPLLLQVWRDGLGGFNAIVSDTVIAGRYDNGTGGSLQPNGTLSTNQWTTGFVQFSPDADAGGTLAFVLTYGRNFYNSDTAALANLKRDFIAFRNDIIFNAVPIIGAITMRGAATNLTLIGDAVFTQPNKFGDF